ncbi:MAG: hypothetical protein ACSI46_09525 [Gloeotrichia echinulata DVL01]|nr:hypothetical protein [Gloeotrichia echinulata DEX184]
MSFEAIISPYVVFDPKFYFLVIFLCLELQIFPTSGDWELGTQRPLSASLGTGDTTTAQCIAGNWGLGTQRPLSASLGTGDWGE